MRKQRRKSKSSINKKFLKLENKKGRKLIIYCFRKGEKPLKPSKENREQSLILIKDENKISKSFSKGAEAISAENPAVIIKSLRTISKSGATKCTIVFY